MGLGDASLDGVPPSRWSGSGVVLRLRSDDLDVRRVRSMASHEVGVEATVVVVSFGGRHVDVVLSIGDVRVDAQVVAPPDDLAPGDRVLAVFDPAKAAAYDDSGALLHTGAVLPAAAAS